MNSTLLVGACEAVDSKLVKLLKQLHCHRLTIKFTHHFSKWKKCYAAHIVCIYDIYVHQSFSFGSCV